MHPDVKKLYPLLTAIVVKTGCTAGRRNPPGIVRFKVVKEEGLYKESHRQAAIYVGSILPFWQQGEKRVFGL